MNFSKRLQYLSSLYQSEKQVWDIGCDHGLLGLSLKDKSDCSTIYLVDPAIEVINVLKNKLLDSDIPKEDFIHILHSKGENLTIPNPEQNLIYIAGMGGKSIMGILKNLIHQIDASSRVVISPHKNILETREYLRNSEWGLECEHLIKDGEFFYQILELRHSKNHEKTSLYGEKIWKGELGEQYKEYLLAYLRIHRDNTSVNYVKFLEGL